jgi:hypothetical protein
MQDQIFGYRHRSQNVRSTPQAEINQAIRHFLYGPEEELECWTHPAPTIPPTTAILSRALTRSDQRSPSIQSEGPRLQNRTVLGLPRKQPKPRTARNPSTMRTFEYGNDPLVTTFQTGRALSGKLKCSADYFIPSFVPMGKPGNSMLALSI